jgi:hypothetical protein
MIGVRKWGLFNPTTSGEKLGIKITFQIWKHKGNALIAMAEELQSTPIMSSRIIVHTNAKDAKEAVYIQIGIS